MPSPVYALVRTRTTNHQELERSMLPAVYTDLATAAEAFLRAMGDRDYPLSVNGWTTTWFELMVLTPAP